MGYEDDQDEIIESAREIESLRAERDELHRSNKLRGSMCDMAMTQRDKAEARAESAEARGRELEERELYLEMIINAFMIQYGDAGVAEWAVAEARAEQVKLLAAQGDE